eukprot:TRINITY_DN16355_c0_g1_i2.p1 TRINITY_DN16355_c0_g1~~TRINITY_DN16355_c0_g1_i2.p1  ORF type:complete len:149 (-),score=27.51 TRINITY_DN16355_c0_g1_i2:84-530(-)
MGAFIGVPVAIVGAAVVVAVIAAVFSAVFGGTAMAAKEAAHRAAPGMVGPPPLSEEEQLEKKEQEKLRQEREKELEEARVAAAEREARRPKSVEDAKRRWLGRSVRCSRSARNGGGHRARSHQRCSDLWPLGVQSETIIIVAIQLWHR